MKKIHDEKKLDMFERNNICKLESANHRNKEIQNVNKNNSTLSLNLFFIKKLKRANFLLKINSFSKEKQLIYIEIKKIVPKEIFVSYG